MCKSEIKETSGLSVSQVARISHETNRAYCQEIGDDSQPAWEDAPAWQVKSATDDVCFHTEHPDASPSASHNNWLKEKKEDGWKYGPVKDPEKKEHPCCVPYNELPLQQRIKDYLFSAVVTAIVGPHDSVPN
jgi:hypothetical protein